MAPLTLQILTQELSVHRLPVTADIPRAVYNSALFSITKTDEELSIVCDSTISISATQSVSGWTGFKVLGPLDFSLTSILAKLATTLADSAISLFAISSYDTDYILVRSTQAILAKNALKKAGYLIQP